MHVFNKETMLCTHKSSITMRASHRRYFADMIIGFLRNEAASLILRGLDVSAQPSAATDLARVPEPMFEGKPLKPSNKVSLQMSMQRLK
jgi:hypothetical protein